MSSILTNVSAITAVQNLAATQKSLASVQSEISTGLAISSAKDNAAYFSIAQTIRTGVSNLSAVSSSLNLGSSVIATGSSATNQITSILQTISADLVTAKSNVGNTTTLSYLNTAISSLNQQLSSIVSSASFNGTNLLDGSSGSSVSFVSGITGSGASTVVNSLTINTSSTNLGGATYAGGNTLVDAYVSANTTQQAAQSTYNTDQATFINAVKNLSDTDYTSASAAFKAVFGSSATYTSGVVTVGTGGTSPSGTALIGSGGTYTRSTAAYAVGTATSGDLYTLGGASAAGSNASQTVTGTGGYIGATATALTNASVDATAGKIVNGALFNLSQVSLTASTSSSQIDAYIKQVGAALTSVNTAAQQLGAASSQISLQSTYISSLSDSLTTGVGSLVDADLNQASTRLNALQTQQQLGVQALSVANQSSQLILKLFQ